MVIDEQIGSHTFFAMLLLGVVVCGEKTIYYAGE